MKNRFAFSQRSKHRIAMRDRFIAGQPQHTAQATRWLYDDGLVCGHEQLSEVRCGSELPHTGAKYHASRDNFHVQRSSYDTVTAQEPC